MISSRDIVEITISIHAPTRGATSQAFAFVQAMSYFNPRSYKRSDKQPFLIKRWMSTFQSTLLQEERHHRLILMISARIFQSTLLQEERRQSACQLPTVSLFQSTLLQEERRICSAPVQNVYYFNPRSYKRSDSKNAQYSLCISAIIIAQCLYNSIKTAIIILCNTKNIAFFRCESSAFSCSLMIRTTLKYQRIFY